MANYGEGVELACNPWRGREGAQSWGLYLLLVKLIYVLAYVGGLHSACLRHCRFHLKLQMAVYHYNF